MPHTYRNAWTALILITTLLLLTTGRPAHAASELAIGDYQLVSSKRISRTEFEYTYKASIFNTSQVAQEAAAKLNLNIPGVKILDGDLKFGFVPEGSSATSYDTFTIQHDRTIALNVSDLNWDIQISTLRSLLNEDYGLITYFPDDLDTLESRISQPALLSNKVFLSADGVPIFSVRIYENNNQMSVSDWYSEVLADKEFTHEDSRVRVSRAVMIDGVSSLQLESEFMGIRAIRTYVPNGNYVIGVTASVPDMYQIPEIYFWALNSLKLM